jgi:putative nucleotidyltransferase with HDIG domain
MTDQLENTIDVDQLQVGVYVYLDVGWMNHPFGFNNFKIRSDDQLRTIRQLGLKSVRWDPLRSDLKPLPRSAIAADKSAALETPIEKSALPNNSAPPAGKAETAAQPTSAANPAVAAIAPIAEFAEGKHSAASTDASTMTAATAITATTDLSALASNELPVAAPLQAAESFTASAGASSAEAVSVNTATMATKQVQIERLADYRKRVSRVEEAFLSAIGTAKRINQSIFSQPEQTRFEASELVTQMVDSMLGAPELAIQVTGTKSGGEDVYVHSLNVSVLAMLLARELRLPAELTRTIGLGSLFHDIGLTNIPAKILNNPGPLSKVEREFRELHCEYGVAIGKKAGLDPAVLEIIFQHHEYADGSGYPRKLKGKAVDSLASVVALVNAYDDLCNPTSIAQALTPHEALSQIFAKFRSRFEGKLLQSFIRFMGVYPPGTVITLSNEAIGLVIAVNAARPLKPTVLIYDPETPRHEAIILDLAEEPDVNITKALRPGQLLPEVCDYLAPRKRVSYYFDAEADGAAGRTG